MSARRQKEFLSRNTGQAGAQDEDGLGQPQRGGGLTPEARSVQRRGRFGTRESHRDQRWNACGISQYTH